MSDLIESVLVERRKFPPTAEFSAQAHVKSLEEYDSATQQWRTRRSYREADSGEALPRLSELRVEHEDPFRIVDPHPIDRQ